MPTEPDGARSPLPARRPLGESRRGARPLRHRPARIPDGQVDQALRRAGYDIGYKDELIEVLEAEVVALREGRTEDADVLRRARAAAVATGRRRGP